MVTDLQIKEKYSTSNLVVISNVVINNDEVREVLGSKGVIYELTDKTNYFMDNDTVIETVDADIINGNSTVLFQCAVEGKWAVINSANLMFTHSKSECVCNKAIEQLIENGAENYNFKEAMHLAEALLD